jgi:hypothetical protein
MLHRVAALDLLTSKTGFLRELLVNFDSATTFVVCRSWPDSPNTKKKAY